MKIEIGKYYSVDEKAYGSRYRVQVRKIWDDSSFSGNYERYDKKRKKYIKVFGVGGFGTKYGNAVIKPCRKGSKRVRYGK